MNLIMKFGNMIVPIIILLILLYAFKKKVSIYDSFLIGAKDGLELGFSILPALIAMLFAINILLKSNVLDSIFIFLKPMLDILKVPFEILPMAFIRPVSGNASFAVMINIIEKFGIDSYISLIAQAIQGTTDTTIYVISLYFGSIGIKKIKYALWAGLLTDLFAVIISIILVSLIFN